MDQLAKAVLGGSFIRRSFDVKGEIPKAFFSVFQSIPPFRKELKELRIVSFYRHWI